MGEDGFWFDVNCQDNMGYICKQSDGKLTVLNI